MSGSLSFNQLYSLVEKKLSTSSLCQTASAEYLYMCRLKRMLVEGQPETASQFEKRLDLLGKIDDNCDHLLKKMKVTSVPDKDLLESCPHLIIDCCLADQSQCGTDENCNHEKS